MQNDTEAISYNLKEILGYCLELKEMGIDCFFNYDPYFNLVQVSLYSGRFNFAYPDNCIKKTVILDYKNTHEDLKELREYIATAVSNRKTNLAKRK